MSKMNWKKVIGWGVAALVVIGVVGNNIYQHREQKGDKPVIKIGAILPLTGVVAQGGQTYKNLYELKISELSKDSKYDYKLIIEDDELNAQKSITAAQKLLNLDDVDVLMMSYSGAEPTIADMASKRGKVSFSLLWDDKTPYENRYTFNALPLPTEYVPQLLSELQKRGIKKVSIVFENHKGALQAYEALKKYAPEYGVEIVDTEWINMGERDFRILVMKMARKNPDVYIVPSGPMSIDRFVNELRIQGIQTPVTAVSSFDYVEDKTPYEGVWYVSDSIINNDMEQKYKKTYGKDLLISQALWGYEALNAVINAYESFDKKPTADQLIEKLYEKRTNTAVGDVQYKGNGILHGKGIMKIIKNGKAVKLEE